MSFDLETLRAAVTAHGSVARVVVAEVAGSTPREVGASMLVWADGQSGTIGGGALEWQAARAARTALSDPSKTGPNRVPLGPSLGQCCGGAVTLLTEIWDSEKLQGLTDKAVIVRPTGHATDRPIAVERLLVDARAKGVLPKPTLTYGWMIEPISQPQHPLWIYGAGHVGRALVDVIAPLPDTAITWVDTALERFPDQTPPNVTILPAAQPADAAKLAPDHAHHLILTYSHVLDLDLCHALLLRPAASIGLIGSQTKWVRFQKRLAALGHAPDTIARITCPIGDPALGKHPQAIAVGVAGALLKSLKENNKTNRDEGFDRGNANAKRSAQP